MRMIAVTVKLQNAKHSNRRESKAENHPGKRTNEEDLERKFH